MTARWPDTPPPSGSWGSATTSKKGSETTTGTTSEEDVPGSAGSAQWAQAPCFSWFTAQYESSSMSSMIREWKWPQTSLIITTAPSSSFGVRKSAR